MATVNGIHHIAVCTSDIKRQIEFLSDVLGMQLVALFWMHGVEGAWHGFMRLNDRSCFALVQTPEVPGIERQLGVTHSGNGALPVAGGALQHLALNVDSEAELLAMRDRIRSKGVNVFGPIDHGLCRSIYFAGPEDLSLEIACSEAAIDAEAWIDPEVAELAGLSPEDVERFKHPESYAAPAEPLPQPAYDPTKPHMRGYPEKLYRRMLEMTDEAIGASASEPDPPVRTD